MPRPHPDPDPDGFWPSCDDQPPGVSIRPLNHADLAALLTHLDHDHDPGDTLNSKVPAPVLAMRVRASVGRPGASTHAEYRRRRATELAVWTHSLPWRIAAVLAVVLAAWLLANQIVPDLAALAGAIVAAGLAWRLRFRVAPDTLAWRRGAAGERRTARLLAPLERRGWAVLHDLAVPGSPANIDHLVIGPGGVVVIDTKQYRGRPPVGCRTCCRPCRPSLAPSGWPGWPTGLGCGSTPPPDRPAQISTRDAAAFTASPGRLLAALDRVRSAAPRRTALLG